MMSSVVEEFSDKYQGRCIFLKIDVDKSEVRPPSGNSLQYTVH